MASAFISGLSPRRTLENTTMGRVLDPGPETKLAMVIGMTSQRQAARRKPDAKPLYSERAILT
ncbi:MAG: hypothetical protein HQ514_01520 [Rhodospirillales bacterium]|nr:hypothetical protein [Rhodospirillales bacterium]